MHLKDEIKKLIDDKTKPIGSLGVIETISEKICLIQRTTKPVLLDPKDLESIFLIPKAPKTGLTAPPAITPVP